MSDNEIRVYMPIQELNMLLEPIMSPSEFEATLHATIAEDKSSTSDDGDENLEKHDTESGSDDSEPEEEKHDDEEDEVEEGSNDSFSSTESVDSYSLKNV
jgi:hypothetical protein